MEIEQRRMPIDTVLNIKKRTKKRLAQLQLKNLPKEGTTALYTAFVPEELQKLSVSVPFLKKPLENKAHVA